jgi:hypothetical protein
LALGRVARFQCETTPQQGDFSIGVGPAQRLRLGIQVHARVDLDE